MPRVSNKRQRPEVYDGPSLPGIDISYWQGQPDFDAIRTEDLAFIISRARDGKDRDHTFRRNYRESRRIGVVRGSYAYFRADRDGKTQARDYANQLDEAEADLSDLVPIVDLERKSAKNLPGGIFHGSGPNLPSRMVLEETLECLEELEDLVAATPMIYTGEYFHWIASQGAPDLAIEFARFPLWVPSYSKGAPRMPAKEGKPWPWTEWTIHQVTGKGGIMGINGHVDINRFRGSDLRPITLGEGKRSCGPGKPTYCATCPHKD